MRTKNVLSFLLASSCIAACGAPIDPTDSTESQAASDAKGHETEALLRPPPVFTPSTWYNELQSALCQQGGICVANEAVPGFEAAATGIGTNSSPLLQASSIVDSATFAYPYLCDDVYNAAGTTCTEGGACCPIAVKSLQLDAAGNPWWVDGNTHHIHYWILGSTSDVDLDAAMGDDMHWQSVGAGSPVTSVSNSAPSSQVWAVTTDGAIYSLLGYIAWSQAPNSPPTSHVWPYSTWFLEPGGAAQIGFMHETNPTSLCGAGWHLPWVRNSAGQIFEWVPQENNCFTGSWTQLNGAAKWLGSGDVVVGMDDAQWVFNSASNGFTRSVQPPTTVVTVNAKPGDRTRVVATDPQHHMWYETCGTFGC